MTRETPLHAAKRGFANRLIYVFALVAAAVMVGCGGGGGGSDSAPAPVGPAGRDGRSALVFVSPEAAGFNCPSGGTKVSAGLDADTDGALGASEVGSIQYVCYGRDGVAGSTGPAGSEGERGLSSLVRTESEPVGARCAAGGTRISVGIDANANGSLDESETSSTDVVCQGPAGAAGVAGAAGPAGATGATGAAGPAGHTSLVLMTAEAAGANCANGGTRVSAGLDANANSTLDTAEVSSVQFVCNGATGAMGATGTGGAVGATGLTGADGLTTLVLMTPEPAGANCSAGGMLVSAGRDTNRNGLLSAGEVDVSDYLCNGAAGAAGATGAPGASGAPGSSGLASLVVMTAEPAGANCAPGGARLDSGLDTNGNGTLEVGEVASSRYVCNGASGAPGASGAAGATGTAGVDGHSSLIAITAESAGSNCAYGGSQIKSGVDINDSGVLDSGEVAATTYTCNGTPGPGVSWTSSGTSSTAVTAQSNSGVLASNESAQVVVTLPTSPAVGDIVRVTGVGAGGWRLAQNAGQSIITRSLPGSWVAAGTDWTARVTNQSYAGIASSSEGTKLASVIAGGQIYTSIDSGATWTARDSSRSWAAVASSADGTKLVAVVGGGQIYTSTDSGANWIARDSARNWTNVASSSDGTLLAATVDNTGNGYIYTSTDSGASWTQRGPNSGWSSIASSADGQKLVVGNTGGNIYTSTDAGANWVFRRSFPVYSLTSSADGTKLAASTGGNVSTVGIFTSSDSGVTWVRREGSTPLTEGGWKPVAISADGTKLVATGVGRWFTSTDSGRTWTSVAHELRGNVAAIALSADGSKVSAAVSGGYSYSGIYTSSAVGERTTAGVGGYVSGGQYDSIEVQHLGGGQFIVLSYAAYSPTGFVVN